MKRTRRATALAMTAATVWLTALGGASNARAQTPGSAPPPGGPTMVQDAPADAPSSAASPGSGSAVSAASGSVSTPSGAATGSSGGAPGAAGGPGGARPAGGGQLSGYSYGSHDSPEVQAILAGHARRGGGGYVPKPGARHMGKAKMSAGSVATYPGFTMREDGGSRVFVQLTRAVPIEEHRVAGQVTYLLKGAHVTERNNENALVTVHFNTPVSRARLRPVGHDLALTIELRGAATPTYKIEGADGGSRLVIDFPEGQFLDGDGEPLRATRAQAMAGDSGGVGTPRAPRRTARRAPGAPRPPAPDSSGMSDTTDSTP